MDDSGAKGYGKRVQVVTRGGFTTQYAHLDASKVKVGDQVQAGGLIGITGTSGNAAKTVHDGGDPHLHWEVLQNGRRMNPLDYLCRPDGRPERRFD